MKVFTTLLVLLLTVSSAWAYEETQTIVTMTTNKPAGQTVQFWVNWNGDGIITANGEALTNGNSPFDYITVPANQTIELVTSGDVELITLRCRDNQLTTLDLINCQALKELDCGSNLLSVLDISDCLLLEALDCPNNKLTELDITQYPNLYWLTCGNNKLTELDVSNSPKLRFLECFFNQLTTLDVTNCPELITLLCNNNQLTALDVTNCPNIVWMVADNQFVSLPEVPAFTDELRVNNPIAYGKETVINVTGASAADGKIIWTNLTGNSGTAGYTFATSLPATADGNSRPFSGMVVQPWVLGVPSDYYDSYRTIVTMTTNKPAGQVVKIEVSWSGDGVITANGSVLKSGSTQSPLITVPSNQTIELVAYGDIQLTTLSSSSNELITLNIIESPDLHWLDCYNNRLTALDVSDCRALTFLECFDNLLTTLDVSNNPALKSLICFNNQLSALDVTRNPNLVWMVAYGQTITLPEAFAFAGELSIDNPIEYNGGVVTNVTGADAVNGKITWTNLTDDFGTASYVFTTNLPVTADENSYAFSGTVIQPWVVGQLAGLSDEPFALSVSAYPNPVVRSQWLTVEAKNFPDKLLNDAIITVTNIHGQFISRTAVTGSQTVIQMPEALGVYIIRFESKDGFSRDMKIIVK